MKSASASGARSVTPREDLDELHAGGVDGVMISNAFSLPYLTKTEPITAITMARIIGELLPRFEVPYGVNVLWDGRASIDLAVATGASDFGLWNTNAGEVARHRDRVDVDVDVDVVAIIGTYFKDGGLFENRAVRSRVEELMGQAKKFREQLV